MKTALISAGIILSFLTFGPLAVAWLAFFYAWSKYQKVDKNKKS